MISMAFSAWRASCVMYHSSAWVYAAAASSFSGQAATVLSGTARVGCGT